MARTINGAKKAPGTAEIDKTGTNNHKIPRQEK
jgi:hypothetical protein